MSLIKLLISRDEVSVQVVLKESNLDSLSNLTEPYFKVKCIDSLHNDIWTVYSQIDFISERDSYVQISEESPDGPGTKVFLNTMSKSIAIDQYEGIWRNIYLLRMIRNLLRWQLFSKDILYMHGGLVEINGKGVSFIGKKKSGKTSSILASLLQENAFYCSNDDLSIKMDGNSIRALGWPRSLCIRPDSLQALKKISTFYIDKSKNLIHPSNNYRENFKENKQQRFYFFPQEVVEIDRKNIKPETNLDIIIFPQFIGQEGNRAYIERINRETATKYLTENYEKFPEKYCGFIGEHFSKPNYNYAYERIQLLAESIPCYVLYQTFDALDKGAKCVLEVL